MDRQAPRAGFTEVDRTADPDWYVRCLDFQNASAFKRLYKERSFALLDARAGQRVLEVGCGLGVDALALAGGVEPGGLVVGLDSSRTMLDEARQRSRGTALPVTFGLGDAHQLPFADETFDRCRADRVFQHLPDPARALGELVRVAKPGGLVLIVEPDHESRIFDSPYPDVSRRFFDFRNSSLRQPGVAHQLYRLFRDLGLVEAAVEPLTEVATDYATIAPVAQFEGGMRLAQEHGVVTADEADRWLAHLDEATREGRFFHAFTYFITVGRKPA